MKPAFARTAPLLPPVRPAPRGRVSGEPAIAALGAGGRISWPPKKAGVTRSRALRPRPWLQLQTASGAAGAESASDTSAALAALSRPDHPRRVKEAARNAPPWCRPTRPASVYGPPGSATQATTGAAQAALRGHR